VIILYYNDLIFLKQVTRTYLILFLVNLNKIFYFFQEKALKQNRTYNWLK